MDCAERKQLWALVMQAIEAHEPAKSKAEIENTKAGYREAMRAYDQHCDEHGCGDEPLRKWKS